MQNNKGKQLIFVGGSPRSGTTLVQSILDSHPNIAGGPEFDRIPDIIEIRNKLYHSIDIGRIDVFCSHDEVDQYICNLIENLLIPFANKQNKNLVSEKTPSNILVFSDLLRICPEAKFIFVIRDPRAIITSMLEVGKKAKAKKVETPLFTQNTTDAIAYVTQCFNEGFKALNNNPDKVLLVIYEKLVGNPETETKKICEFLKIDWHDSMLLPGEKEHVGAKGIDNIWYDTKMYKRNIEKNEVSKWHDKLSYLQIIQINKAFQDNTHLTEIGYKFDSAAIPLFNRLIALFVLNSNLMIKAILSLIIKAVLKSSLVRYLGKKILSTIRN